MLKLVDVDYVKAKVLSHPMRSKEPLSATMSITTNCAPCFILQNRSSRQPLAATLVIVAVTLALSLSSLARILGFKPLPFSIFLMIGLIVVLYAGAAEAAKHIFYRLA